MQKINTYLGHVKDANSKFETNAIKTVGELIPNFPEEKLFLTTLNLDEIIQKTKFEIAVVTSLGRWADFQTQQMWLENSNAQNIEQNLFEELNASLLKKELSGSVMPFANIAGKNPEKLLPYLAEYAQHFQGLKVLASSMLPINAPEFKPVLRFCEKENWPVLVHCGSKKDSHLTFQSVYETAQEFPGITFTASHCGGDNPEIMSNIVAPAMRLENAPKNLFLNTAIRNYEAFAELIQKIGLDKIVFGSDIPLLPENHQARIEAIIGEKNLRQIWEENPQRSLNLG